MLQFFLIFFFSPFQYLYIFSTFHVHGSFLSCLHHTHARIILLISGLMSEVRPDKFSFSLVSAPQARMFSVHSSFLSYVYVTSLLDYHYCVHQVWHFLYCSKFQEYFTFLQCNFFFFNYKHFVSLFLLSNYCTSLTLTEQYCCVQQQVYV